MMKKGFLFIMPQYELMYIVASSISDDEIPTVTDGVLNFITELGGKVIKEEHLGKKKLAYPVAKTRNGYYVVINFEFEPKNVSELDAKVRNAEGIIRHLIINMEESMRRMAKDAVAQEKMNKNRTERAKATEGSNPEADKVTDENLDEKIEAALSEDITA
jgi:small subunit ribosomal protein S6